MSPIRFPTIDGDAFSISLGSTHILEGGAELTLALDRIVVTLPGGVARISAAYPLSSTDYERPST